jgi:DNA primase
MSDQLESYESPLEAAWTAYADELYGASFPIPPSHGWVKVRCALHSERRPSAQVNLELGKWRCFAGCGHGDIYDLIGLHDGVHEFPEQKRIAAEKFGDVGDTPPEPSSMNPNPRQPKGRKKKWKPAWT